MEKKINLLEENAKFAGQLDVADFLDMTPWVQATKEKIDKLDIMKIF